MALELFPPTLPFSYPPTLSFVTLTPPTSSPPPPLEKLDKHEIFQFAHTIPDFIQLEKTRKKLEVFRTIHSEYPTLSFVTLTPLISFPLPLLGKLEKLRIFQFTHTIPDFIQLEKTRKKLEVF